MDIRDSLADLLRSQQGLNQTFYPRFFELCPEAKQFFTQVDMKRQAILLGSALISIVDGHEHNLQTTVEYLNYLGKDHEKWGIPKEWYTPFQEALLLTLKEHHGQQWDDTLATQWQEALQKTIALILQGYQGEGKAE